RVTPVRINTKTRWIFRATSLHLCPRFRPGTGVEPVAAGRRAVILQPGETRELLACLDRHTRLCFQSEVRECLAVNLFRYFRERRILWSCVGPGKIQEGIRKLASFLLVKLTNFQKNACEYFLIDFRFTWRRHCYVLPLQPARRVNERAIFLREARAWQTIDGRVDGLHLICRGARSFPELGCLFRIQIANNEEISFLQCLDVLSR